MEEYVNALKSNQYNNKELPKFTDKHIDKLLEYRNERDSLVKFPYNPVSSFYQEECELGIYILWTIEYIRIKSVNSNLLIMGKFPSMNPILELRNSKEMELIYGADAYRIVSDAYYAWWMRKKL